ncbi:MULTISPECIES: transporter substrate-binding domain-containing protein [unclassified Pseudomonas]|uniref:transporter substrate-binding domain-containing protein n=1 Tax=unclassified Pseudomonas TaxID=196821 RepID=UPI000A1DDA05|nr:MULTISPECIES: transporter substrate-binding domain-containing protein [unclassified Pseudomonas]
MLFYRKMMSALGSLCLMALLAGCQEGKAAQLAMHEGDAPPPAALELDPAERQWIRDHPEVAVASVQYPLYLFQDEHGHWSGLNNDVLQRIGAMTGLVFVHRESFSTEQMLERLKSGAADISTTLAMNDERKAFLDFSHAFGGAGWVFVGKAGAPLLTSLEQLAGRVLVLPARHALEEAIRREYPAIRVRSVKTYAEARALVESGEAHATIENEIGAQLYPSGLLKVGGVVEGRWEADHLALRKGQPELRGILNKALEAFPAQELRAIRLRWLGGIAPPPKSGFCYPLSWWGCWLMFFVGVFGVLSMVWNRRLSAVIRQRRDVERHLGDQLAFQRALIDAMPDPVFVRDPEGRLVMCNKSYEESLSTRFDRVQGRRLIDVDTLPESTARMLHDEFMAQMGSRKTRFSKRRLLFKGGLRDIYQWTVPFYGVDGQLRGLVGGWTDINQRKAEGGSGCP